MAARITDYYSAPRLLRRPGLSAGAGHPRRRGDDRGDRGPLRQGRSCDNHSNLSRTWPTACSPGLERATWSPSRRSRAALLLLSDLPGVVVNSTLVAGRAVGTSDLLVDLDAGPARHRQHRGRQRRQPLHRRRTASAARSTSTSRSGIGDVASLRVLTVRRRAELRPRLLPGASSARARSAWPTPISAIASAASSSSLDAMARRRSPASTASYPLIRSRDDNLVRCSSGSTAKQLQRPGRRDLVGRQAQLATSLMVGLTGDHRDTSAAAAGPRLRSAGRSASSTSRRPTALRAIDAVTARTNGELQQARLRRCRACSRSAAPLSLYGEVRGQSPRRTSTSPRRWSSAAPMACAPIPRARPTATRAMSLTAEARLDAAAAAGADAAATSSCSPSSTPARSSSTRIPGSPATTTARSAAPASASNWARPDNFVGAGRPTRSSSATSARPPRPTIPAASGSSSSSSSDGGVSTHRSSP